MCRCRLNLGLLQTTALPSEAPKKDLCAGQLYLKGGEHQVISEIVCYHSHQFKFSGSKNTPVFFLFCGSVLGQSTTDRRMSGVRQALAHPKKRI